MLPKVLNVFDQIGITAPCSAAYFPEKGTWVSMKVVTKGYISVKKNYQNLDF